MVNLKIFLTEQKFWRFQYAEWFHRTIKKPESKNFNFIVLKNIESNSWSHFIQ